MPHDIYADMRQTVLTALRSIVPDLPDDIAARVEVSPARDAAHGDMATNAAMVSAKAARQPPAKIAAGLVAFLGEAAGVKEAAAAGPGFVNLRLEPDVYRGLLPTILRATTAPFSRRAALALLNSRYDSVDQFNTAWQCTLSSWDDLVAAPLQPPPVLWQLSFSDA